MARKRKYDYNGTLLNLALLGGAAIILKKRTGRLAGINGNRYSRYFNTRGEEFDRILAQADFIQAKYERDLLNAGYTKQTVPAIVADAYWQKYSQEFNSLMNRLQIILENQYNKL